MSRKKFSDLSNLFILVKLFLHPDLYKIRLKIERYSNSPLYNLLICCDSVQVIQVSHSPFVALQEIAYIAPGISRSPAVSSIPNIRFIF